MTLELEVPETCIQSKLGSCAGCPLAESAAQMVRSGQEKEVVIQQVAPLCPTEGYRLGELAIPAIAKSSIW